MSTATLTGNASTLSNMYAAFGRGDINFILDNLADDCKWIGAGEGTLPQGGTYIGKQAALFFQRLLEAENFEAFDIDAIHNINNNEAVAFGHIAATSKSTGKKIESDW